MSPKYKRILLKLSGEAIAGEDKIGINTNVLKELASQVKEIYEMGVEVAIVVGGGNFFRGKSMTFSDRTTSDHIGMLGTVMNGLALEDTFSSLGIKSKVISAIKMDPIGEFFNKKSVVNYLENGYIVIFVAGTGHPYFSTDTTAALRAIEIDADAMFLGKNGVDGVYNSDPKKNPQAKKIDKISYIDLLKEGLEVMDTTATSLCMDNKMPVIVFGIEEDQGIVNVSLGKKIGTYIEEE